MGLVSDDTTTYSFGGGGESGTNSTTSLLDALGLAMDLPMALGATTGLEEEVEVGDGDPSSFST